METIDTLLGASPSVLLSYGAFKSVNFFHQRERRGGMNLLVQGTPCRTANMQVPSSIYLKMYLRELLFVCIKVLINPLPFSTRKAGRIVRPLTNC